MMDNDKLIAFIKARPIPDKLIRNLQKARTVSEDDPIFASTIAGNIAKRKEERTLYESEKDVLYLASCGIRRRDSACYLELSQHTVESHLANARIILGARNTQHAVAIAIREELI